jgi:hypothetical protein
MSKGAVTFSKNNEFYTPKNLIKNFGNFDYDPATTEQRSHYLEIAHFDTIESNGLSKDWYSYKKIWINPPFTIKHLFLEKAVETYCKTRNEIYFLCPIEFLTTKRFHNITKGVGIKIYLPSGRIKFETDTGVTAKQPAFGCVILKLQEKDEISKLPII